MEIFWLSLQSFISYNASMVINCSIAEDTGRIGFYPSPRPLSNFQSMGFFFSPSFFYSPTPLSPQTLFASLTVFGLKKTLRLLSFFLGFFFLGSLCWRHFRSLNKLWELVLFILWIHSKTLKKITIFLCKIYAH